jgi:hypothetical protein
MMKILMGLKGLVDIISFEYFKPSDIIAVIYLLTFAVLFSFLIVFEDNYKNKLSSQNRDSK